MQEDAAQVDGDDPVEPVVRDVGEWGERLLDAACSCPGRAPSTSSGSTFRPRPCTGCADAATLFSAVFGYDAMSTAAEQSKESERNLPKVIVISVGISDQHRGQ